MDCLSIQPNNPCLLNGVSRPFRLPLIRFKFALFTQFAVSSSFSVPLLDLLLFHYTSHVRAHNHESFSVSLIIRHFRVYRTHL